MTTTSTSTIPQSQSSIMPTGNNASSSSCQFSQDKRDDGAPKGQFPKLLHNLISSTDDSVVSWNPQGTAFCINDHDQFMAIAQQHFKLKQSRTFTRRLSLWGFQRVGRGKATTYQHTRFHRDFISLCRGMKRTKTAKSSSKKAPCVSSEQAPASCCSALDQPASPSANCTSNSIASMRVLDILNEGPLSVPMMSSQSPLVLDNTATEDIMMMPLLATEPSPADETSKSTSDTRSLSSMLFHDLSHITTMSSLV